MQAERVTAARVAWAPPPFVWLTTMNAVRERSDWTGKWRGMGEKRNCARYSGIRLTAYVSTASALSLSGWIWLQIALGLIELHVGGRGGCELTC